MKSAVNVVLPAALGVHEHVAVVVPPEVAVETEEQPDIAVPPALKVTLPATLVVAVMVVGVLKEAEAEREIVGVA